MENTKNQKQKVVKYPQTCPFCGRKWNARVPHPVQCKFCHAYIRKPPKGGTAQKSKGKYKQTCPHCKRTWYSTKQKPLQCIFCKQPMQPLPPANKPPKNKKPK